MTAAATRKRRGKQAILAAAREPDLPRPHTVELAQHCTVEAPDRVSAVWRIRTNLDAMLAAGLIDAACWQAGDSYRRDYEVGQEGGRIAEAGSIAGPGGSGCPTQARLDALARLAGARAVLNIDQQHVMDALAINLPWIAVGPHWPVSRRDVRAKRVAIEALGVLTDHYRLRSATARIRGVEIEGARA